MNIPEMNELDESELNYMSEVKIWRPVHQFPAMPEFKKSNGKYEKYGPFHTDSHSERKKILNALLEELNIDWENPDEIIYVKPKWAPFTQTVK